MIFYDFGGATARRFSGLRENGSGGSMELHRATPLPARSRPIIECAQCGEHLFSPEWSEFVDARRVRHLWECDACGYAFETTIRVAAA
jgi:hypothetical protein